MAWPLSAPSLLLTNRESDSCRGGSEPGRAIMMSPRLGSRRPAERAVGGAACAWARGLHRDQRLDGPGLGRTRSSSVRRGFKFRVHHCRGSRRRARSDTGWTAGAGRPAPAQPGPDSDFKLTAQVWVLGPVWHHPSLRLRRGGPRGSLLTQLDPVELRRSPAARGDPITPISGVSGVRLGHGPTARLARPPAVRV